MSEKELRALIDLSSKAIGDLFYKDGHIIPMWHAIDDKGREHLLPSTLQDKDTTVAFVRALFEIMHVKRYVFIDEAWMLSTQMPQEAEVKEIHKRGIANHPERIEIVLFSGEDSEWGQLMAHRRIERPPGKRAYLGPLQFPDGGKLMRAEGRMVGLLPAQGAKQ